MIRLIGTFNPLRKSPRLWTLFRCRGSVKPRPEPGGVTRPFAMILALCLGMHLTALSQAAHPVNFGGVTYSAGVTASGYYVQFGERTLFGLTGFADADIKHRLGAEAEARWLVFNQFENIHAATYLIGPRYRMTIGRFQTYAKGLAGVGEFNFNDNNGRGSYLVAAAGGGVDYRLNHRIQLRLADFEYQFWPEFTEGAMTSYGVSSGIRVKVF